MEYLSADQRLIRRWRSLLDFVVKKNNRYLITFRSNHGSSACEKVHHETCSSSRKKWRMGVDRRTIGGFDDDDPCSRFRREEEQSSFDHLSNQSRFLCLLEGPSRNMFFFAQKVTHGYLSADQRVIRRWRSLLDLVVKKNNHHLITFRSNHGSSAC